MQSKTFGWRVVNQHDLVPQLPPGKGRLLFDFHHAPREVWYINDTIRCVRERARARVRASPEPHVQGVRRQRRGPHVSRLAQGQAAEAQGPRHVLQYEQRVQPYVYAHQAQAASAW